MQQKPIFPPEITKYLDLAIYVLDARAPYSTFSVEKGLSARALFLLNKADLADPLETKKWISLFESAKLSSTTLSKNDKHAIANLKSILLANYKDKKLSRKARGIKECVLRIVILGMPNVGKSTVINLLVGKRKVRTGDRPGITRGYQWVRILDGVDLLDTRGIYREYARVRQNSAKLTAINVLLPEEDVIVDAVNSIISSFTDKNWKKFYCYFGVTEKVKDMHADELLTFIGKATFGQKYKDALCIDVATKILNLANDGTFGAFTLEKVEDEKNHFLRLVEELMG